VVRFVSLFSLLAAAPALTACDTLGSALGMDRSVPDDNQVTKIPPLSIPPDYALKPPRETPKNQEVATPDQPTAQQPAQYTPSPASPTAPAPMPR
jgi:hypothetical protein